MQFYRPSDGLINGLYSPLNTLLCCRLHEIAPKARDAAMLHLLDSIQDMMAQDPALAKQLSVTAFVTTTSAFAAPASLYDPRNEDLVALLDQNCHFPSGVFAKDDKVFSKSTMLACLHFRPSVLDTFATFSGAGCTEGLGPQKHGHIGDAAGCSSLS